MNTCRVPALRKGSGRTKVLGARRLQAFSRMAAAAPVNRVVRAFHTAGTSAVDHVRSTHFFDERGGFR